MKHRRTVLLLAAIMLAMGTNLKAQVMQEKVDFSVWPKGELNTGYAKVFHWQQLLGSARC
jgi:hypothetical protein